MLTRADVVQFTEDKYKLIAIIEVLFEDMLKDLDLKAVLKDPAYLSNYFVAHSMMILETFGPEAFDMGLKHAQKIAG